MLDHPGIMAASGARAAMRQRSWDRLVTVAVPHLGAAERAGGAGCGAAAAEGFRARGLIEGAALFLQGEARVTGRMGAWRREDGASG